jgi:hypothetical protein
MPKISLVVCVSKERDLLERLLLHAKDCFDDLVVVHDGVENDESFNLELSRKDQVFEKNWESPSIMSLKSPNTPPTKIARDYYKLDRDSPIPTGYNLKVDPPIVGSIHELVTNNGGRFFEGPRCFQQEPHWPFAWHKAKFDWILRLDADEYPDEALKQWLINFRESPAAPLQLSGYTCIWPLWDGHQQTIRNWPDQRFFLFNKIRVRFFAMAEQTPIPEFKTTPINLSLNHAPKRKSYGLRNVLIRKQAYVWRTVIAKSLFKQTTEFPTWNWNRAAWPTDWERIRSRPFKEAIFRLVMLSLQQANALWKKEKKINLSATTSGAINHFLFSIEHGLRRLFCIVN